MRVGIIPAIGAGLGTLAARLGAAARAFVLRYDISILMPREVALLREVARP